MIPYYADEWVTIYHGDCRDILPHVDAAVMVTDPPYGIDAPLSWGGSKGNVVPRTQRAIPEWDRDLAVRDAIVAMWAGRPALVFGSITRPPPPGVLPRPLIWHKGKAVGMGDVSFPWGPTYEVVWIIGRGFSGPRTSAVLNYNSLPRRDHPNEKPVDLLRDLIGKCPPGVIVDPFMGSGTTLRAAKDLGRRSIGIEIEERYCSIAVERLRQEVLAI